MKQPSFEELLTNKKARARLTLPQLNDFYQRLNALTVGMGRPVDLPANPAEFAVQYSRGVWRHAAHLDYLSKHLVKLEQRGVKRILVSMPPRHGKSLLIDTYFPAWWLALHPADRVVLIGYNETFARKWGADVRDLIIEHSEKLNLQVNPERTAADDWQLTSGGGMLCVGYGGSLMGKGADLMILDDVVKSAEEAESEVFRDKIWEWFQSTALTRLQPNAVIIGVMTRWHQDDLFGRILENQGDRWEVINIPSIAEANDPLGRAVGEPLWPEFHTDDPTYEIRKNSMSPYWWSALHQGRPTPEGGGLLKRDWFRFYQSLPQEPDQWIQSWDLSLKDKESNDYSVGQVWLRKGPDLYLVDQVRGHFNLSEMAHHMRNFMRKYPKAIAKLVEDSAMGPALKQTLQHEVAAIIPIVPSGSKWSRAQNIVPYLQGGNIHLPESPSGTKPKWVWEFVEECAQFDKGAYDDQVDAFSQAVGFLGGQSWGQAIRALRDSPIPAPDAQEIRFEPFRKMIRKANVRAERKQRLHDAQDIIRVRRPRLG